MPLSLEREHRVGTGLHAAMYFFGKMNSEKRKPWIWNRIDQASHKMLPNRGELVVFSPKRHDPDSIVGFRHPNDSITVEPSAVDPVIRRLISACFADAQFARHVPDRGHPSAAANLPSSTPNQLGVFCRDLPKIGDRRG